MTFSFLEGDQLGEVALAAVRHTLGVQDGTVQGIAVTIGDLAPRLPLRYRKLIAEAIIHADLRPEPEFAEDRQMWMNVLRKLQAVKSCTDIKEAPHA